MLHDIENGIVVNGIPTNNLPNADHPVLLADSLEGLQSLLNRVA